MARKKKTQPKIHPTKWMDRNKALNIDTALHIRAGNFLGTVWEVRGNNTGFLYSLTCSHERGMETAWRIAAFEFSKKYKISFSDNINSNQYSYVS